MSNLPLPLDTTTVFRQAGSGCRNLGLLFERYIGYESGWSLEGQRKYRQAEALVAAANQWANEPAYRQWVAAWAGRWRAVMTAAGAEPFEARLTSRLVVGLGRESAFETGLTLHRVCGLPYIPGSALKGMTQAWAEAAPQPRDQLDRVFGVQASSGDVVFFDAFPTEPPRFKLDILNPHYPGYYRTGDRQPPADWQNPVPVYFITVAPGTRFLFGVGERRPASVRSMASTWLQTGLRSLGVGGKTTSGYGVFVIDALG